MRGIPGALQMHAKAIATMDAAAQFSPMATDGEQRHATVIKPRPIRLWLTQQGDGERLPRSGVIILQAGIAHVPCRNTRKTRQQTCHFFGIPLRFLYPEPSMVSLPISGKGKDFFDEKMARRGMETGRGAF